MPRSYYGYYNINICHRGTVFEDTAWGYDIKLRHEDTIVWRYCGIPIGEEYTVLWISYNKKILH